MKQEKRFEKVVKDSEEFQIVVYAIISMIAFSFIGWVLHMITVHGSDKAVYFIDYLRIASAVVLGLFYIIAIIVWGVLLQSAWDEREVYWREKE